MKRNSGRESEGDWEEKKETKWGREIVAGLEERGGRKYQNESVGDWENKKHSYGGLGSGDKEKQFFIFLILKNLGTRSGIGKEKYYPLLDPKFI